MHNKKNQKKHFDTYVIIILQGFGGLHNTQLDFISSKKKSWLSSPFYEAFMKSRYEEINLSARCQNLPSHLSSKNITLENARNFA